jgi:hypothetical protein
MGEVMSVLEQQHINAVRHVLRQTRQLRAKAEAEPPSPERDQRIAEYDAKIAEFDAQEQAHANALRERGLPVH